jgi:hypothetical protein
MFRLHDNPADFFCLTHGSLGHFRECHIVDFYAASNLRSVA